MRLLQGLLLSLTRRVPVEVLRRAGRWTLKGPRRRAMRARLLGTLGDAPRTIDRGAGAGLRLSAARSNLGYAMGVSEPAVQAELVHSLRPGMVFYDVGANVGFLTLIAARLVGESGSVVAFEPLAGNVELLQRNLDLNAAANVTVVRRALSAAAGRGRMAVADSSDAGVVASLDTAPDATGPEVLVGTLDGTIGELGLRPPDLVKIDVEGAEVDVLGGMASTLSTAHPRLLIEIHDDGEDRWREDAIRVVLERQGYRLRRLDGEDGGMPHLLAIPPAVQAAR